MKSTNYTSALHRPVFRGDGGRIRADDFAQGLAAGAQQGLRQVGLDRLDQAEAYSKGAVTTIETGKPFYRAEAYHQNYLAQHLTQPYIMYNDLPKLEALKREFPEWFVEQK